MITFPSLCPPVDSHSGALSVAAQTADCKETDRKSVV